MKKVLIVEDDVSTAELVKFLLLSLGCEVTYTGDGSSALRLAREWLPQLIVLDIMLPGLDGYSIQSELLKDDLTKEIPVILITVKTQMEQVFTNAGNVAGFMCKPFNVMELQSKVKSVLENRD